MKKTKALLSGLLSAVFITSACTAALPYSEISAASGLSIDYGDSTNVSESHFYFSDENEFFTDNITVYYDDTDVTSQTKFYFNTSPASTYDGKNTDYTVPFIAEYNDKYINGQIDVKIGLRGDANCDHKITANDLVLIENELLQKYQTSKSALTANNGLGIFLANSDGIQNSESIKPFGTNDLNIADALFLSRYLKNTKKSLYENILQCYAIRPEKGELSVSKENCTAGDIVTLYISQKSGSSLGAFEFTCRWNTNLKFVNAYAIDNNTTVFSSMKDGSLKIWGFGADNMIKDGNIIALQLKVPQDAKIKTTYDVYVQSVEYFGSGINIANKVAVTDGGITVTAENPEPDMDIIPEYPNFNYKYGIKAWDAAVDAGTTSVDIPVMLLGGLEAKELKLIVQCDAPLSVETLNNAIIKSSLSDGSITGIYSSQNPLNVDFETLNVSIAADAKPGKYPINISVEDVENATNETIPLSVYSGSITIKEKYQPKVIGDANDDGKLNIRDAAFIAIMCASGTRDKIPSWADFNGDGQLNIRDAAAIAIAMARR